MKLDFQYFLEGKFGIQCESRYEADKLSYRLFCKNKIWDNNYEQVLHNSRWSEHKKASTYYIGGRRNRVICAPINSLNKDLVVTFKQFEEYEHKEKEMLRLHAASLSMAAQTIRYEPVEYTVHLANQPTEDNEQRPMQFTTVRARQRPVTDFGGALGWNTRPLGFFNPETMEVTFHAAGGGGTINTEQSQ